MGIGTGTVKGDLLRAVDLCRGRGRGRGRSRERGGGKLAPTLPFICEMKNFTPT